MKNIRKILIYMIIVLTIIGVMLNIEVKAQDELIVVEPVEKMTDLLKGIDWSDSNPIDRGELNSNPNYFCTQHWTSLAVKKDNILGDGYHSSFNLDNFVNVKYSASDGWIINPSENSTKTYGPSYKNSGENPTDETYSNFYYREINHSYSGGFAFLLAKYKEPNRTDYRTDPLQHAVWEYLNQLTERDEGLYINELKEAELAFDAYYKAVTTNPNVSCTVGNNDGTVKDAGTVKDGDNYKVGPFTMSSYVRAVDYTYTDPYRGNTNLQEVFGSASNMQGTVISATAVLNNGKEINFAVPAPGETFYVDIPINQVGDADELEKITFTYQWIEATGTGLEYEGKQVHIDWVQDSEWTGCTSYDCTTCKHTGIGWEGRSDTGKTHISWCLGSGYCSHGLSDSQFTTEIGEKRGCNVSWACGIEGAHTHTNSCKGYKCGLEEHTHGSTTCYTAPPNRELTCKKTEHRHDASCIGYICGKKEHTHDIKICKQNHNCTKNYCIHGHEDGKHSGTNCINWSATPPHDHECEGTTVCKHGHTTCKAFRWKISSIDLDDAQDAMEAYGTLTPHTKTYTTTVNIPLTTNVSIYKYITKVEHEDGTKTFDSSERKNKTNKLTDTVKVERGDKVTFKIEIVNSSRFDIRLKVRDTLPSPIEIVSIPSEIGASTWITVPANSSKMYDVVLKPNSNTGSYTNSIAIITTNESDPPMEYIKSDGQELPGPIVNLSNRLNDSDSYTIKEYDITIDKKIVEVSHVSTNTTTYTGNERKNIDETLKNNNPVYVEYGDKVKYEIEIYNTCSPSVVDRGVQPYWNPDKVFVNIEDILPKKYSDIDVKVSNETGNIKIENTKFKVNNIEVPAGGSTKVIVTLTVTEHDKTKQETNTAKISGNIFNINKYVIKNNSTKTISSDYYHINDYNVSLHKYINNYNNEMMIKNNNNGFTSEENKITNRYSMTEQEKYDKPVPVEKTETIEYAIRLNNDSVSEKKDLASGEKKTTGIRPTTITDTFQKGLKYKSVYAKVYTANGKDKYNTNIEITASDIGNNAYNFTINNKLNDGRIIILEPGEYMIYYITAEVTESNMYLHRLSNTGTITTLTNINNTDEIAREVKNDDYDENIASQKASTDYVKMKDLVIAGKVWLDRDKDGLMDLNKQNGFDNTIDASSNTSTHIEYPEGSSEYAMKNIIVKLYRVSTVEGEPDTLVRTTKTDENGLFTFAKNEDGTSWYNGLYSYDNGVVESEQRIDKATGKDANKNYTENSELIQYYIEYLYDGLVYKSTEVYAGNSHLDDQGRIDSEGIYKIDSNAAELNAVRDEFSKKYEVIAFDKGYEVNYDEEGNYQLFGDSLSYEKNGHNSWIQSNNLRGQEDENRIMKARSFIDRSKQTTNYLWLYEQTDVYQLPETEYLKYINLGLEEREAVDISITNDVYEVKTTINGEQMTYEYNQNDYALGNSNIDKEQINDSSYNSALYMTGYKNDNSNDLKLYQFKTYNSDYYYKVSQYNIDTVKEYKGEESELNVETTFRIRVTNNSITNDEPYLADGKKDIKVYTGINEIAQYYDTEFMDLVVNNEGDVQTFNIKTKDENGYLVNTPLKVVNAVFVKKGQKIEDAIPAVLSTTSEYNKDNDGTRVLKDKDGVSLYNTLYVRPKVENGKSLAGDIILAEGESVDILITFSIDKSIDSDLSAEQIAALTEAERKEKLFLTLGDKINVAEISAYSTYYKNSNGTYYPAGLVDRDSNPGNFGELYGLSADKNVDSNEYLALYEDDTFKAGITFGLEDADRERNLMGFVWDDARTETVKDANGTQYIGDGIYDPTVEAEESVNRNEEVANQEINDYKIKDMKTQLVEMIKIPIWEGEGDSRRLVEERVYEETIVALDGLSQMVTKTNADGIYQLKGYIPGEYIVKFFYGHDDSSNMLIFNGQDYKSTTYQAENSRNVLENHSTYTSGNNVGNSSLYYGNNGSNGYYDYYGDYYSLYYGNNDSNGYYDYYENGDSNEYYENNNSNGYYDYYDFYYYYGDNANGYYDYYENGDSNEYYENNNSNGYYDYYEDYYSLYYGNNDSNGYDDYYTNSGENNVPNNLYAEYQENSDMELAKLEEANISDAKDDEIRRLEVISYSETMNNKLNNTLRGKNTSSEFVPALVANTNMVSETTDFLIKTEKELANKKILTYKETLEKFDKTKERHPIKNIDFGIEYRPELQISLEKYISNITITTSDKNSENMGTPLVDAKFNECYGIVIKTDFDSGATEFLRDAEGNIVKVGRYAVNQEVEKAARDANVTIPEDIQRDSNGAYIVTLVGTELDTKNSVGLSNLQYVENMYDKDAEGKTFLYDENGYIKTTQGFVYLNIDDEIMQGATISIKYVFAGNNLSEIDRVSSSLSELRFKENENALKYRVADDKYYNQIAIQQGEKTGYIDIDYSGAMTARNKLFSEYYAYEVEDGQIKTYIDKYNNKVKDIVYRIKTKTIDVDDSKKMKVGKNEDLDIEKMYTGYFGRYLGSTYYTGKIGEIDIVAELKIDKILDYIDNDLVFDNSKNNSLNNLWKTTTSVELLSNGLVSANSFITVENGSGDPGLVGLSGKYLLDSKYRAYDTAERSNLAVLLDDRIKDYEDPANDITVNKDISKYLSPRYSDGANSFGTVSLVASKVISAEELSEDMNYENIGEIIQYSSVTGRVTPLSTTLGNVSFFEEKESGELVPIKEWDEARKESDTAATEQITLTPPTGLGRVEQIIRNTVEGASYTVIAIIAVSVVVILVFVGIKLYRKRRIK